MLSRSPSQEEAAVSAHFVAHAAIASGRTEHHGEREPSVGGARCLLAARLRRRGWVCDQLPLGQAGRWPELGHRPLGELWRLYVAVRSRATPLASPVSFGFCPVRPFSNLLLSDPVNLPPNGAIKSPRESMLGLQEKMLRFQR